MRDVVNCLGVGVLGLILSGHKALALKCIPVLWCFKDQLHCSAAASESANDTDLWSVVDSRLLTVSKSTR